MGRKRITVLNRVKGKVHSMLYYSFSSFRCWALLISFAIFTLCLSLTGCTTPVSPPEPEPVPEGPIILFEENEYYADIPAPEIVKAGTWRASNMGVPTPDREPYTYVLETLPVGVGQRDILDRLVGEDVVVFGKLRRPVEEGLGGPEEMFDARRLEVLSYLECPVPREPGAERLHPELKEILETSPPETKIEIIISFCELENPPANFRESELEKYGVEVGKPYWIIYAAPGEATLAAVVALEQRSDVTYISPTKTSTPPP